MSWHRSLAVASLLAVLGLLAGAALLDFSSASEAPARQLRGEQLGPAGNSSGSGSPENSSHQDPEGPEPLVEAASVNATAAALLGRAGAAAEGAAAADSGSVLELALSKKAGGGGGGGGGGSNSPLCARAPEGQTCVPNGHGHSNSYVYCSAHRLISPSATSCEARMGRMSWCVGGGIGLTHNYCDDPFCRNGGAYAGSGDYCHNGNVVRCSGQNAPKLISSCADTTRFLGCCRITTHYTCAGGYPHPYCARSGESRDCSDCQRRRGTR